MATKKNNEKAAYEELNINELKKEIIDYAEKRIEIEAEQAIKRIEKRILKQKNISIIKKNIIIIILLCLSAYLTYILYGTGYFNKHISTSQENKNTKDQIITEKKENTEIKKQEELLEKYSYLMNSIEISETSSYIKDYYKGNLTDELKLYLSVNNIEKENLIEDGETLIIDSKSLKNSYNKLFNDENYKKISFEYHNIVFKYLKTQDIYVSNKKLEKNNTNIIKVINSIEKTDKEIIFLTTEALVEKNKIYNIETKKEIDIYKDITTINNNKEKLNNMKYIFSNNEENYYLTKIESMK